VGERRKKAIRGSSQFRSLRNSLVNGGDEGDEGGGKGRGLWGTFNTGRNSGGKSGGARTGGEVEKNGGIKAKA